MQVSSRPVRGTQLLLLLADFCQPVMPSNLKFLTIKIHTWRWCTIQNSRTYAGDSSSHFKPKKWLVKHVGTGGLVLSNLTWLIWQWKIHLTLFYRWCFFSHVWGFSVASQLGFASWNMLEPHVFTVSLQRGFSTQRAVSLKALRALHDMWISW